MFVAWGSKECEHCVFIVDNIKVQFSFQFYLKMYYVVKAMETIWNVLHTNYQRPFDYSSCH